MEDSSSAVTANSSRRRARHSKVKTGCITCRIRRVKCDEAKPTCQRCFNYGTECAGYQAYNPPKASLNKNNYPAQVRPIRPKILPAEQQQSTACILVSPSTRQFNNDMEQRYFNIFKDHISRKIYPLFNPEKWTNLVLQACAVHPSIRHAAVAIGALGKTCEIAKLCKKPETGERVVMDVEHASGLVGSLRMSNIRDLALQAHGHHREALEQYEKAIQCMKDDIEHCRQDLRTTLIICLVIICFEGIHGNYKSAAAQLQTGLSLVHNFQAKTRRGTLHPQGFSSPSPDVVDDFLVQSFGRLEIQCMSVFDPRPTEVHVQLKDEGKETIEAMPSNLKTIEEARIYLDLITRRIMHFNGSIHTSRIKDPGPNNKSTRPLVYLLSEGQNPDHNPIPWIDLKIPLSQTHSTISSELIQQEQSDLLEHLIAWNNASDELLRSAVKMSPREAISALTMRIAALSSKISLCSAFFLNESAYDNFIEEFKETVRHANQIFALQRLEDSIAGYSHTANPQMANLNFSFEIGLIPALYTVVIKCRHGPTRRKALNLLRSNPRREGVWDSVASSGLGAWVLGLEEEGARRFANTMSRSPLSSCVSESSGEFIGSGMRTDDRFGANSDIQDLHIPEEVRVRKAKMRFDLLERRANLFCMQVDFNTGLFVEKNGIFRW